MDENEIIVFASISLKDDTHFNLLTEHMDLSYIKSNDEVHPHNAYTLLILHKKVEGVYSEVLFRSEKVFDAIAFYDPNINIHEDILNAIKTLKTTIKKPGVLSSDQIANLIKVGILVYDSDPKNIKAASYDLTLNSEHFISGVELTENHKITIDPLDFIIVRANETANIPSNISANFDIRVSMFCKGIILSNGPQIDPGYMGRFLCLLYNSSSKSYETRSGERFCTIVFQALSSKSRNCYSGKYQRKPSIEDYVVPYAKAGISTNIQQFNQIKEENKKLAKRITNQCNKISTLQSDNNSLTKDIEKIKGSHANIFMLIGFSISILSLLIAVFIGYFFSGIHKDVGTILTENTQIKSNYNELKEQFDSYQTTPYK